jgi:hypothetical protein
LANKKLTVALKGRNKECADYALRIYFALSGQLSLEATRPRGPTYRSVPALGCHMMAFQAGRIPPAGSAAMAAHRDTGRRGRMPRLRGTIFARDDQEWKKHGKNVKGEHFSSGD